MMNQKTRLEMRYDLGNKEIRYKEIKENKKEKRTLSVFECVTRDAKRIFSCLFLFSFLVDELHLLLYQPSPPAKALVTRAKALGR